MKKELSYWANEYREWQKSGVKQTEYCKQKGHRHSDFKEQTREARQAGLVEGAYPPSKKEAISDTFLPITINETSRTVGYCKIEFSSGSSIHFSDKHSFIGLKDLITSLMIG